MNEDRVFVTASARRFALRQMQCQFFRFATETSLLVIRAFFGIFFGHHKPRPVFFIGEKKENIRELRPGKRTIAVSIIQPVAEMIFCSIMKWADKAVEITTFISVVEGRKNPQNNAMNHICYGMYSAFSAPRAE